MTDYTIEDEGPGMLAAYNSTMTLLGQHPERPSAIFYFNDLTAEQGYRAIKDMGLNIPQDISVIGVDNYRPSALMNPPLTTFEHPKYELGRWTARILLSEMEPRSPHLHMKMVFEPILVERKSVAILA
jgi:DNA-binding LacI/PurR family transcriptional regulator